MCVSVSEEMEGKNGEREREGECPSSCSKTSGK